MIAPRSLSFRLLAGAALWTAGALVIAWIALSRLFEAHLLRELSRRMEASLNELAALVVTADGNGVTLARDLTEPRFRRPYSGLYWQVSEPPGGVRVRSRSLWDGALALPPDPLPDGRVHQHRLSGPEGAPVIAFERSVALPGREGRLRVAVAENAAVADRALAELRGVLAVSLGTLGVTIALAAVAQVLGGLRPLRRLRDALSAVRDGRLTRVEGTFPDEVQPLVDDLNGVLAQNEAVLVRARTQAGNLAHSLKTPLAVLANEATLLEARGETALAERIARQTERMQRQVEYHLARARAAAAAHVPGVRTPVAESLAGLARLMGQVYRDRSLRLDQTVQAEAVFRGERQDLDEMLGNLLDNAHKWARSRVRVTAEAQGDRLVVRVEDDGPGLAPAQRGEVFERGRRLDESVAGTGLGLAIVRDLAELYGGRAALDDSALGGLSAELTLPGVAPG